MFLKALIVWIVGLVTIVPYGTYYLFFRADRDEYALLITIVLFWIFGFWGVAGPLIAAMQVRMVFRALETAGSRAQRDAILRSDVTRDLAIDMIARENGIPRFLATRIYGMVETRLRVEGSADETVRGSAESGPGDRA